MGSQAFRLMRQAWNRRSTSIHSLSGKQGLLCLIALMRVYTVRTRSKKISFITATFRQPIRLKRAISSLLAQANPNWEMVISPDDGENYEHFSQYDHRIRVVSTAEKHTGAGMARNRGRAIASGDYIAVLDDDDLVTKTFVHDVLQALESAHTVTVPTAYVRENGHLIREVGAGHSEIDIPRFSRELGSMHVISEQRVHQPWRDCFAEDVLHTCIAIANAGGKIPVVDSTRYVGIVRQDSTCTTRRDIGPEYERLIRLGFPDLPGQAASDIRRLFEYRHKTNTAFEESAIKATGYHEILSSLDLVSGTKSTKPALDLSAVNLSLPRAVSP